MSFLRVKTDYASGRQYLYEEVRSGGGYQKSRSLGRVGAGFWFWLGVLVNNLTEPRAFNLDEFHAEQRAQELDIERKEAERERLAEVVNPATYATHGGERPHSNQVEEVALESPEVAAPEVPQAPPSHSAASIEGIPPDVPAVGELCEASEIAPQEGHTPSDDCPSADEGSYGASDTQ